MKLATNLPGVAPFSAQAAKQAAREVIQNKTADLATALEQTNPLNGVTDPVKAKRLMGSLEVLSKNINESIEAAVAKAEKLTGRPSDAELDTLVNNWTAEFPFPRAEPIVSLSDDELNAVLKHLTVLYQSQGFKDVGAFVRQENFGRGLERGSIFLGPGLAEANRGSGYQLITALGESDK
jgi:hypothetical protein